MTTPTQEATMLYAQLKPGAVNAALQYVLSRTPNPLQTIMQGLINTDLNPIPDPSIADVHDGDAITVVDFAGANVAGTAHVAGGSVTNVTTPLTPTVAKVADGGAVVVHSLADGVTPGSPAVAHVAANALTKVNLTV